MALPIITAIRQRHDLKESILHTVIELAHRASIYGVVRVSLRYLAAKCHCCKQTIINHLKQLIALKILSKTVLWIKGNLCETNTYRFLIPWQKRPAQTCHSQNSGPKFPPPEEGEKKGGVGEKIQNLEKGLIWYTEGSIGYESTMREIARLKSLLGAAARPSRGINAARDQG